MAYSSAANAILKPPTPLEQLLEEINFQRTKEMRQLMTDDSEFVMLQGTTYWTDLFVRHFLFQNESTIDCDDLLFFVRKKHVKGSPRYMPKFETEVDVFRKDSRKLPIGDPDIDWEETVYLNLIIHQFEYTLTLAICTRTSPKELQVLKRHSQKVYASPSRRRMDTKGEVEEITYPHVCFMVDNFDEVFQDILVRDGEMVCVELVAADRTGSIQGVIFLGSIRYDALKKVYDARQSSLSTKMAQRMTFGLFSNVNQQRCEFVRMKGPQGKGHAEMAVTKPKGSGVETPTSEPGFCATDLWDEWDEETGIPGGVANEDYYTYRQQRRLSDPSANLNNFVRGAWRTKLDVKSRSECEGLDSMENGCSEIEAGDLRDVQVSGPPTDTHAQHPTATSTALAGPASSSSSSVAEAAPVTCCCGCFRPPRMCVSRSAHSIALSDFYGMAVGGAGGGGGSGGGRSMCRNPDMCAQRSPLGPPQNHCKAPGGSKRNNNAECEYGADAINTSLNGATISEHIELPTITTPAANGAGEGTIVANTRETSFVNGKEELPCLNHRAPHVKAQAPAVPASQGLGSQRHISVGAASNNARKDAACATNNNCGGGRKQSLGAGGHDDDNRNSAVASKSLGTTGNYCTLPKRSISVNGAGAAMMATLGACGRGAKMTTWAPPKRVTTDGTHIYYWCDLSRRQRAGNYLN